MKKNNGITLISLVVTILILLLLSTVTVNVGVETYNMIKVENFKSELKVIQAKVDNIAEETDDVSNLRIEKIVRFSDNRCRKLSVFFGYDCKSTKL